MILLSPEKTPEPPQTATPVAVLASGNGSNFAAIADAVARGELGAEIRCVVYNNEDAFVAKRAENREIPAVYVDHRRYESRESFDEAVVEVLREHEVEWVVMAGWMRVATEVLLDAYEDRILNIHPSLLPSFRGLRAVEQALRAGVKVSGCTVHVVRLAVDDGPIVAQAAVPVHDGEEPGDLQKRIHEAEHILYPRAIALALAGALDE